MVQWGDCKLNWGTSTTGDWSWGWGAVGSYCWSGKVCSGHSLVQGSWLLSQLSPQGQGPPGWRIDQVPLCITDSDCHLILIADHSLILPSFTCLHHKDSEMKQIHSAIKQSLYLSNKNIIPPILHYLTILSFKHKWNLQPVTQSGRIEGTQFLFLCLYNHWATLCLFRTHCLNTEYVTGTIDNGIKSVQRRWGTTNETHACSSICMCVTGHSLNELLCRIQYLLMNKQWKVLIWSLFYLL